MLFIFFYLYMSTLNYFSELLKIFVVYFDVNVLRMRSYNVSPWEGGYLHLQKKFYSPK